MEVILFTDVADTLGYGKYAGTYKIATEIRKKGYTCQVIDNFSWLGLDRLKTLINKFVTNNTLLIGFSCTLNEKKFEVANSFERRAGRYDVHHWGLPVEQVKDLIAYAKNVNRNLKTCAGGARISKFSDYEFIDYCVVGKADYSLLALLDHLKLGNDLKLAKNSYSYIIDSNDYFYGQSEFANSQIVYDKNDIIFPGEVLPMEISRGCIFSCAFCKYDLIGKRLGDWTKNSETIYQEMLRNYEQFGIVNYLFTDEIINESTDKLQMLIEATSKLPAAIKYSAYARVDLIYRFPEMRELLLESGALSLSFGIETFNHKAGKLIGKGLHPDKVKETLKYCKELWHNKILMSSNFIIGLPEENEESIRSTFEYLMSDDNPLDLFSFSPLAIVPENKISPNYSKMEKDPEKYGYKSFKIDDKFVWVSNNMDLNRANEIGREFYRNPNMEARTKFATTTMVGRILGIGYTAEEIFRLISDKEIDVYTIKMEINKRTNELKYKYYQELLKLRM